MLRDHDQIGSTLSTYCNNGWDKWGAKKPILEGNSLLNAFPLAKSAVPRKIKDITDGSERAGFTPRRDLKQS